MHNSSLPVSNEQLAEQLSIVTDLVHEVRDSIMGNPSMGNKGLASRLEVVEDKTEKHDRKLLVWGSVLIAAGISAQFLKDFVLRH